MEIAPSPVLSFFRFAFLYPLSSLYISTQRFQVVRPGILCSENTEKEAGHVRTGIPGLMAFKKTVDYCKSKDLVVIGDIKRGDIGSTSAAYAVGHLGKVKVGNNSFAGFDEDFVTVNPYLGTDGVKPFVDVCKEEKKVCSSLSRLPTRQAVSFRIV